MGYVGNIPALNYTTFAVQHFTTSATTSYTLDNAVTNENGIALFINNVRQEPGSSYAYTATGTALTLSAATTTSDTMYCVFIGKAVQTVNPGAGSVGTSQLATDAVTTVKITDTNVTGAKLNDDAISAQDALGATPADTDEFLVSDAGVLKRVDYSYIKGGITEFDQWRFDTTYVGAGGLISANWERNDNNFAKIGTGMSESSGIWTFPSTGIWFISFYITFSIESGSGQNYAGAKLYVTSNDATYATASFGYCSPWQNGAYGTAYCNMGFDVTDVSQCKMKIYDDVSSATDLTRQASGTDNYNAATFIRLGDT